MQIVLKRASSRSFTVHAAYSVIIPDDNRVPAFRDWLTGSFAGRALLLGFVIKSATLALAASGVPLTGLLNVVDTIGGISLFAGLAVLGYRLFVSAKRRLLWRVRRKLTLSYIFIGFVPALLIIAFFLLCGLLLFFNVSAYMLRNRVASLVDQAQFLAQSAALELQRAGAAAEVPESLARRHAGAQGRYPQVSYAVVPGDKVCGSASATAVRAESVSAGAWGHMTQPASMPAWVPCEGFAGLIARIDNSVTVLAARGVAWIDDVGSSRAVVVDVPLSPEVVRQIRDETGIAIGQLTAVPSSAEMSDPPAGGGGANPNLNFSIGPLLDESAAGGLQWVAFLEHMDWTTGTPSPVTVSFGMNLRDIYNRISGAPLAELGAFDFGQVLLILVAVVGGLFLVIQVVAFGMGLALARSITGSVHELFAGTERVRQGDFTHKIAVRTRDQLGELADSFNSMTSSIEDLLQQKAEKERLEQELRIAREIQMSLLPQGPLRMPGLSLTAHCEPAREVGGDYYDFLPIDDYRYGILIADVAGKGTSAALYMAELKGLILSLSHLHRSPRQLLIDANRIISQHLDARSFITITYVIVDLEARTLTHARAGHCPMMYVPGTPRENRRVQILSPDGLVLGLRIDAAAERFNSLLEEVTTPIAPGDVFLLYTDGIPEAMNEAGDWFGDARLGTLLEEHAKLSSEELRERILREVRTFVGATPQHDDMTMLLLKVDEV